MTIVQLIGDARVHWRLDSQPPVGHISGHIWRSHTAHDAYDYPYPEGGREIGQAANGYRIVKVYPDARAILTYCEGDLGLEVYPDGLVFEIAVESACKFYSGRN